MENLDVNLECINGHLETGSCEQTCVKKKRRPAILCIECPICKGPAPDHLHFGGQCCYSCRAFFRRTSHKNVASFRCRGGQNNCKIISGSRSCIPCRLTKCLQVGMDPGQVRGNKSAEDNSESQDDDSRYIVLSPDQSDSRYILSPARTALDQYGSPPLCPPNMPEPGMLLYSPPSIPDLVQNQNQQSEAVLRFKAGILKYQGMCLQYQASLLEEQATSRATTITTNIGNSVDLGDKVSLGNTLNPVNLPNKVIPVNLGNKVSLRNSFSDDKDLFFRDSQQSTDSQDTLGMIPNQPFKTPSTSFGDQIPKKDTSFFNDLRNDFENNGYSVKSNMDMIKPSYAEPICYSKIKYNPSCYLPKRSSPITIVENPNHSPMSTPFSPSPLDLRSQESRGFVPLTGHEQVANMPRIFFKSCTSTSTTQSYVPTTTNKM